MMGLGYLGSSSSSASAYSNLSPLAPPFTVERSNHNKPNFNSNPVSHFNDPSYGVPFNSSWQYSQPSTSRQEFSADSIRTATVPSANDYGYMSPDPINPPTNLNWSGLNPNVKTGLESVNPLSTGTRWSAVNPSPNSVTDSFSFNLTEAKPFYPPYVSSVNHDDIPLVSLNEPSYDLLSASGLVHGDKSFKVDYTQSLSGLEYNPQREGIWSGPPEEKQRKRMEEANIAASLAYENYRNQGAYGAETLSKGKDDSTMFYYADTIRRENNIGSSITRKSDVTSFSANNHGLAPNEFSEGPTYSAFPVCSESHQLVPSREPPQEPWNAHKSHALYEKKFHMFDCSDDRISPSVTKSSSVVIKPPALVSSFSAQGTVSSKSAEIGNIVAFNANDVIKPPALVSSFSAQGTVSSKSVEIGNIVAFNANDVVGNHNPSKEMELHLPQGLETKGSFLTSNQPGFQLGTTDEHTFVAPFSTKEEMSTKMSTNDQFNFEFKARPTFQVPDINIPDVSNTESVNSAANSFEHLDHHNPAEDSPCWKGASTSYFSPFGSPEAEAPQHPTKKLQISNGVNSQGSPTAPPFNHSSKISSSELLEVSESNERTTPHEKEHKSGDAVGVGFDSAKASSRGGAQSSHDIIKPRKVYGFLNESTGDENSQTYQLKLLNLQEDDLSKMKIHHPYGDMEHTIDDVENVLVSSVEDAANLAADEKMNTNVLVKALHNLSDLLLRRCSNDGCSLTEQDHEALDHVIGNLDVCMLRKIQQVTPTQKLMLHQQKSSNMFKEVTNETTGQLAGHHRAYLRRNDDIFGKNVENLLECASPRDEAALPKDDNMIQAIKKVLDENLECKEELPSQVLLYKNLWLEAEAALCAFNYKTRFEHMKREMEKWKLDKATVSDASEITADKKIPSFNGSPGLKTPPQLIHEADGSKVSNTQVQQQPLSSANSHVDDVEASVMARFNILKHRGEPNPVNLEEQELADDKASGKESQGSGATVQSHLQCYPYKCNEKGDAAVNASGSDIEPSVMARLNILKRRGESNPVNDVKEQADTAEAEVFGKESQSSNGIMGLHFQDEANKEAAAHGTSLMQNQFNSGWYNASYSSSDWEHILKDEFSWQTNGRLN